MSADAKNTLVSIGLAAGFLALAGAFLMNLWGRPAAVAFNPPVAPDFTNTATVRLSAAELFRTEGDTSGMACYSCHDEKKPVTVKFDAKGTVILSEPHRDLVMRHGRNNRNDNCFICHDSKNLVLLRAHEGQSFKLTESTRLCGSCHGPTYRDWEAGIHGRTGGFWSRQMGAATRQDCTACHDPHNPAFPPLKPAPAPRPLHLRGVATAPKGAH
ncbi:MAG: hypothetical protein HZA89_18610 [Verrucomicrobia bacterium]|nr:hypothetical protein [Verrucomicrobiota bacterium]